MPITPELSKKLLDLKEESGLTFKQIGDEVGSSEANVRRYIMGETKLPDRQLLVAIIKAMDGDPNVLLPKAAAPQSNVELGVYERIKSDYDKQLALWHTRHDREIETLKQTAEQTIRNKDEWLHKLKDELAAQKKLHRRTIAVLIALIVLLSLFVVFYLVRDIADSSWGYIRY